MKRFNIVLTIFFSFAITSCSWFKNAPTTNNNEPTPIGIVPDSIKQHLIKQGPLYVGLIAKIDTLTNEINSLEVSVANLQHRVDSLENPKSIWDFLTTGVILIAITALLLLLLILYKKLYEHIHRLSEKLREESSRIKSIEKRLETPTPKSSRDQQNDKSTPNENIERRIKNLERELSQAISTFNRISSQISDNNITNSNNTEKTLKRAGKSDFSKQGYATLNSGKYFFNILESNQEGCVFHINFKSPDMGEGEFDLISLDKIKSSNGWQEVINTTGDCTMEEATDYKLEKIGICQKMPDEKTWEITQKLQIKILK